MAHNIVGTVVRNTVEKGGIATDIRSADLDDASNKLFGKPLGMSEQSVSGALDPAKNIEVREMLGGPGLNQMAAMIKGRMIQLRNDNSTVAATRRRVIKARDKLIAETKAFCKGAYDG